MDLNNILNPSTGGSNSGGGTPSNPPGGGPPSNNPTIHPLHNDRGSNSEDYSNFAVIEPSQSERCADFLKERVEIYRSRGVNHRTMHDLGIYKSTEFYALLTDFAQDNRDRFPQFSVGMAKGNKAVIFPGNYSIIEAIRVYRRP